MIFLEQSVLPLTATHTSDALISTPRRGPKCKDEVKKGTSAVSSTRCKTLGQLVENLILDRRGKLALPEA